MGKTGIIIVLALILVLVSGGVYFYMTGGKIPGVSKTTTPSLGEQIFAQTKNPLEDKLPETNPFAKVNPFKGVYKNPFE